MRRARAFRTTKRAIKLIGRFISNRAQRNRVRRTPRFARRFNTLLVYDLLDDTQTRFLAIATAGGTLGRLTLHVHSRDGQEKRHCSRRSKGAANMEICISLSSTFRRTLLPPPPGMHHSGKLRHARPLRASPRGSPFIYGTRECTYRIARPSSRIPPLPPPPVKGKYTYCLL